jgi:glucosamine--fructose-6-phosphate aminotransferase (isomerizing)
MTYGNMGLGHTRMATNGNVSLANAHPYVSFHGRFSIVHRGMIENYESINFFLSKQGFKFYSETDTEVLVKAI